MKMSLRQRLKEYRIALRSLAAEAEYYPTSKYPHISLHHMMESVKRAKRVLLGEYWDKGEK